MQAAGRGPARMAAALQPQQQGAPRAHLSVAAQTGHASPEPAAAPRVQLGRFEDVVALAHMRRDIQMKIALERDVRLIAFEQGVIAFELADGASQHLAANLSRRLQEWTGQPWRVTTVQSGGAPSIKELADAQERDRIVGVRSDPLVQTVLERFPGAQIVSVRTPDMEVPPVFDVPAASDAPGDEVAFSDRFDTGADDDDDDF